MKKLFFVLPVFLLFASCASLRTERANTVRRLHFAGEFLLPDKTEFSGTRVGGLSGIDYDSANGQYYLISDDRSDYSPARFYTARISLSERGIDSVRFVNVTALRQKNGETYPNKKGDSLHVPDPEAMRLNRATGNLVWSSEGERIVRPGSNILLNPSINVIAREGTLKDTFELPANLHVSALENGPRRNGVFEGLAFTPDFRTLFVSVEEPLYEDGPRAGLGDSTAWIRFLRYDAVSGKPQAQYAYRLDAVAKAPEPLGAFRINGVPDILTINDHELLVIERSFSTGYVGCNVKVYRVNVNDAEDVSAVASLQKTPPRRFLRKTLLLNMDKLGREVYNVEGATFGPRLPNGKRSLLFVADNNFSDREKTQFLLFEVD